MIKLAVSLFVIIMLASAAWGAWHLLKFMWLTYPLSTLLFLSIIVLLLIARATIDFIEPFR